MPRVLYSFTVEAAAQQQQQQQHVKAAAAVHAVICSSSRAHLFIAWYIYRVLFLVAKQQF
jgi:hypothetical protein